MSRAEELAKQRQRVVRQREGPEEELDGRQSRRAGNPEVCHD